MLRVGSDFSGVGAFNQALMRLGVEFEEVFACDMDKYARDTFIHNYGEPTYYPTNVYDREIPAESLDIYMTSPPCQAFSLAGKRLGKEDKRGILFFNSHEFIQVNKPRFFIFENVKGLLSDDGGRTFQEWVNMLGGKSVNGVPVLFPYEDSVPYHLYWQVLNAKNHGVPQNRERVFLVGIRDDQDNKFQFPREEHLTKRLKDVLEDAVDDKYFLSEKMLGYLENRSDNFNNGKINYKTENDYASCLNKSSGSIDISDNILKIGDYRKDEGFRWREDGNSPTLCARAREDGSGQAIVMQLNQSKESGGVQPYQQNRVYDSNGISPAMNAGQVTWGGNIVTLPNEYKIRRLTPRECFRLMDFPDAFTWKVSDSQAYKQAGNSIVVNVLYKILKQLPL
jgi:DNA (cytosine-5)-methyltransferase 1